MVKEIQLKIFSQFKNSASVDRSKIWERIVWMYTYKNQHFTQNVHISFIQRVYIPTYIHTSISSLRIYILIIILLINIILRKMRKYSYI